MAQRKRIGTSKAKNGNGAVAEKALPAPNPAVSGNGVTGLEGAIQQVIGASYDSLTFRRNIFPAWWSPTRDRFLRRILTENDWISSATETVKIKLTSVPFHVEPRSRNVQAHAEQAEQFNVVFQMGWERVKEKFVQDVLTQDNGGFIEILDAPGDLRTPPDKPRVTFGGFRNLDAARCQRTNDPDYPVLVRHTDNKLYKLHESRVIDLVSMPSADQEMHGVGLCPLSRALHNIQLLNDIAILYQEFLGSRPLSQILFAPGMEAKDLKKIFDTAEQKMDAEGMARFSRFVFVGVDKTDARLESIVLRLLPEGFNKKDEIELAIMLFALAFGVDAREFWPATTTGATKADAMVSHMKAQAKTPAWFIDSIERVVEQKVLPSHLELESEGLADDEGDRNRQELYSTHANATQTMLNGEVIDQRAARVMAMELGAVPKDEFERMELEAGRLLDGNDVLTLFYSKDAYMQQLLNLAMDDPLDIIANDSETMIEMIDQQARIAFRETVQGISAARRMTARRANAALLRLRALYEEVKAPEEPALESDEDEDVETAPDSEAEDEAETDPEQDEESDNRAYPIIPPEWIKQANERWNHRKSSSSYGIDIRQTVRQLWRGSYDMGEFAVAMYNTIESGFIDAFNDGAKSCGLSGSADYTDEERSLLNALINAERGRVLNFGNYIQQHSKANGGLLRTCLNRAALWTNAYSRVQSEAQTLVCSDQKFEWELGKTEKHCKDCTQVTGRVYRGSIWRKHKWRPQGNNLQCGGWRCDCKLKPSTKPLTPGRPPEPRGQKGKKATRVQLVEVMRWFDDNGFVDYTYFDPVKRAEQLLLEVHGEPS